MADTQQKRNPFIRLARTVGRALASRPTRSATGLEVQQTPSEVKFSDEGVPGIVGGDPVIGTRTVTSRGAPRGLSFLADFLTSFGAGPEAAARQQQQRGLSLRQNLQEQLSLGKAQVESLITQIKLAPKPITANGRFFLYYPITGEMKQVDVTGLLEKGDLGGLIDGFSSTFKPALTPEERGGLMAQAKIFSGLPPDEFLRKLGGAAERILDERDKAKGRAETLENRPKTNFDNFLRSQQKQKEERGESRELTGAQQEQASRDFANLVRRGFTQLTNLKGETIGFYSPISDEFVGVPIPGVRKTGVSPAELAKSAQRTSMLKQAVLFEKLLTDVDEKGNIKAEPFVGVVAGFVSNIRIKTIGGKEIEVDLQRESGKMLAEFGKSISGGAIAKDEMARLTPLMPGKGMPYSTALRLTQLFIAEMKTIIEERERVGLAIPKGKNPFKGKDPNEGFEAAPNE